MAEKQPLSSSVEDSLCSVFIFTENHFSKINEIVRDYLGSNASVSFFFTCADGITREYGAVADAKKYDNPKDRQVTALWIYGNSEDSQRRVSIRLATRASTNTTVSLRGPGITVANCHKKIEEWLDGMRPWYAPLASPIGSLLALIIALLMVGAGIAAWAIRYHHLVATLIFNSVLAFFFGAGFAALAIPFHNWLFPTGFFAFGQGVERQSRRVALRSGILGLIGLGLLVGFTSSIIASYVFQVFNTAP